QAYRGLAMLNPTMSASEAAKSFGELTGPSMQRWASTFGVQLYNTDNDHSFVGNSKLADQFLTQIYGTPFVSEEEFQAGLSGGSVAKTLAAMPIDTETASAFASYLKNYVHMTNTGGKRSDIDQLLADAS